MPKVWYITGSAKGFGRIWAEAALARGDQVAATARDPRALDELVDGYGDRRIEEREAWNDLYAGGARMSAVATRVGAESTAAEVIAGIDLTGKRAIVTGASSGIGPGYMQQVRASARLRIKTVEHGAAGVAPYALDPDNADRLWEVSSRLVNA